MMSALSELRTDEGFGSKPSLAVLVAVFDVLFSAGPPPRRGWCTTQSGTPGTRQFGVTYAVSGQGKVSKSLNDTAREFAYATNNPASNSCTLGYGTKYTYTDTLYTHPDNAAVQPGLGLSGTAVLESFSSAPPAGTIAGPGALNANSQFNDIELDTQSEGANNNRHPDSPARRGSVRFGSETDVSTYSSDPPNNTLRFDRPTRKVALREGLTTVRAKAESAPETTAGKIRIIAPISEATKGLEIKAPDPPENCIAELTIIDP